MAKRVREQTSESIDRKLREGRGKGRGLGYKPWLTIHDVPSRGQANRVKGFTTKRTHHLLSLLELRYFYLLDWLPKVVDIREQFPLPLEDTRRLARELGIRHPANPKTGEDIVMTSDFRITVETERGRSDLVRTVKYAAELGNKRVLEKLLIEKQYWESQGINWGIVTENGIPSNLVHNAEWVQGYEYPDSVAPLDGMEIRRIASFVRVYLQREPDVPIRRLVAVCEERLGYPVGTVLPVIKHMIASRKWFVDMDVRIDPGCPLRLLNVDNRNDQDGLAG